MIEWALGQIIRIVSLDGFWTTIIGVTIGYFASSLNIWWQNRRRRVAARMQVATNLRHWINRAHWRISQTIVFVDSGGHGGKAYTEIPEYRFEESQEQITLLDNATATKLFNLIHKKDEANAEIEGTAEFNDYDDAVDVFRGRAASQFLATLSLYESVSRKIKWSEEIVSKDHKKSMEEEVARFEKIQKDDAASNAKFFEELNVKPIPPNPTIESSSPKNDAPGDGR